MLSSAKFSFSMNGLKVLKKFRNIHVSSITVPSNFSKVKNSLCGVPSLEKSFLQLTLPEQLNASFYSSTSSFCGQDNSPKISSQIEGFQGEHEFSSQRAKEIQNDIEERNADEESSVAVDSVKTEADINSEAYEMASSGISLYSCMQSNVPEPYQPDSTAPTHLNMPGGGTHRGDKYVAENRNINHPSRNFSTSSFHRQSAIPDVVVEGNVTGSDAFKIWLNTCQSLNIRECNEAIEDLKSGRKTLKELFEEQEKDLKVVASRYREILASSSVQGLQGDMSDQLLNLHGEGRNVEPQGIQGDNGELFKLWLQNCRRFGFVNCNDLVRDYQSGKKTMAQLFEEQDVEISKAAELYKLENAADGQAQPSQGQKFKRAIKDYGSTVVIFHVGISLASLGCFYTIVSSGVDVIGLLQKIGFGEAIIDSKLAAGASTFVLAYAVHKLFAPVRIGITLSCTPFIVQYLRRVGILKASVK